MPSPPSWQPSSRRDRHPGRRPAIGLPVSPYSPEPPQPSSPPGPSSRNRRPLRASPSRLAGGWIPLSSECLGGGAVARGCGRWGSGSRTVPCCFCLLPGGSILCCGPQLE